MLLPWLGDGRRVILGLLQGFLLLHIGGNDPLGSLQVVADDEACVVHKWDLPVLHYHKIMVIYPYPFLVVITQLFS